MLARVKNSAFACKAGRLTSAFVVHTGPFQWEVRRGVAIPFSGGLFLTLRKVYTYPGLSQAIRALAVIEWEAGRRNIKSDECGEKE